MSNPVTLRSFEDMSAHDQAWHLCTDHGFNQDYFDSYFDPDSTDRPVDYDMSKASGVVKYFEEELGVDQMRHWHDDDHEEVDPDGHSGGGGPLRHTHRAAMTIPGDVLASLREVLLQRV